MPPKSPVNGFAVFMWEMKDRRRLNMSGGQLAAFCGPLWAQLSAGEKKQYDLRAKEMKKQSKGADGDMARRDNAGNIIGTRKDPEEERRKRRQRDQDLVTRDWHGKDLTEEKFYFVNFQDMCELTESDNNTEREWLPREVGMVEFSLRRGITSHYHAFINPGPIPKGFKFTCIQKSESTHKIPVEDFEHDSADYTKIWRKMKELLRPGMKDGIYPPVFCLDSDYDMVKYLMDWMWYHSDDPNQNDNPVGHVCAIEDLVVNLLAYSNQPNTESISCASVVSKLDGSHWDYISNTSCDWHEDQETKHCALGVVRRYAFTISDILAQVYNIQLTDKHVPTRSNTEEKARVLPPESMPTITNQQRMRGRGRGRDRQGSGGDARRKNPSRYAELRRGNESACEESDFSVQEVPISHFGGAQPQQEASRGMFFGPKMSNPWGHQEPPVGPASGQFDDWPALGGEASSSSGGNISDLKVEQEDPRPQMAALSLSGTSPSWLRGAVGRGTTTDASSVSGMSDTSATSTVSPPPGFANTAFGPVPDNVPGVGRGMLIQQNPGVGRGAAPFVGRGSMPVGRGVALSMNVNSQPVSVQTPQFTTPQGATPMAGPSWPSAVGRGIPSPLGRGLSPGVGRGMPAGDVNLSMTNFPTLSQSAVDSSVTSQSPYLSEQSDENYTPPPFMAPGGRGVGRGMPEPLGRSAGMAVGRGMPGTGRSVGRGYPGLS